MAAPSSPETAFATLFRTHWSDVHAYARRRCGNDTDAHDIAAETFTVAWRRFGDLPEGYELPWLYRTAANVLANQRRRTRRGERLHAKLAAEPTVARAGLADAIVDDHELRAAFLTLTEVQRELLTLVAWEGLDHAQLAVALDTSVNAVALRLSRARAHVEDALAPRPLTDPPPSGHGRSDRAGRTS